MFCRSICWFICTSVALAIVIGYSAQDINTGSDSEVKIYHFGTDNLESSRSGPDQEVWPSTAVDLGALLDAGEGAVVTLVAGDTRLAAHRAVLSARSAVFQRLLQDSSTDEVAVPDVEGPVLRQLVSYLYTLRAPQLPAVAPQLLAAAHQYGLPALKADCKQQVAKQLSVETAAATAVLAIKHSCDSLRKASIDYIRTHIFHVMATQGWADAVNTQFQVMIKVMELLSQSPAENRSLSQEEKTRRLREAAKQGAVGELEALLAAGADVAARDGVWLLTPLHWAADWGQPAVVRLLLAAGADHGARDVDGRTPLHLAAFRGHREAAAALLEAGADRAARDSSEYTPLDYARERKQQQLVQLLHGDSGLAPE